MSSGCHYPQLFYKIRILNFEDSMKNAKLKLLIQSLCMMAPLTLTACNNDNDSNNQSIVEKPTLQTVLNNFKNGAALPTKALMSTKDADGKNVTIYQGGYGSDGFVNPNDPTQFYALTDRGPNSDVVHGDPNIEKGEGKAFPMPNYTPNVGLFQINSDGKISLVKIIELKRPDGITKTTGLPNPVNGATKEVAYIQNNTDNAYGTLMLADQTKPYSATTNSTKTDAYGIDAEGLAVMKDGTFWVSDEYGPHIVHYDATGKEIGRINAFSSGEGASTVTINNKVITLPGEFKNRRANRGMEGLTVTPDQQYLVGIMQSALYNPNKDTKKSNLTRLVRINLATGQIEQFIYQQTEADSNSGIVAVDKDTFYVIERDGDFPKDNANAVKKVFKIDLRNGTNIESITNNGSITQDDKLGLLIGGKTLEQLTLNADGWTTLKNNGINSVSKTEYLNAVTKLNYPHDKLEGLMLFPNGALGLINDDDFGIMPQDKYNKDYITQKYVDKANTDVDSDRLYIYRP